MERHRCKLCFRNFANGRALGGHMRSHMVYLPAAPKDEEKIPENHDSEPGFSPSPSSSSSSEQSETEPSMENRVHRRPRRARKSRVFYPRTWFDADDHAAAEETSSVSDTTAEEDVAYCLMMLSRDSWEETGEINRKNQEMEKKNKFRGKYRCETCGKVFKSYQALGGHRASHGRIKAAEMGGPAAETAAVERIHECPFCHKVFASGQALGGHKRSHFVGASVISANVCPPKQFSRIGGSLEIDLNLPPQEDDEISQVAISAVSDAEFFQEI